jgi:hypothetical protein
VFLPAALWVWLFACGVGLVFLLVWSGFVFGCLLTVLAFPCILSGLLALPLCGAALTFFAGPPCQASCRCAKKESDGTSLYMLYP